MCKCAADQKYIMVKQISFIKSLEDSQQFKNLRVTYLSRYFFNTYLNNRLYYSWIAHTPNCQENCKLTAALGICQKSTRKKKQG